MQSFRPGPMMSLLLAEQKLREVLELLDENGLALAAIHVANALALVGESIDTSGTETQIAVGSGSTHLN